MKNSRNYIIMFIFILSVIACIRVFYICSYRAGYYKRIYKDLNNKTTFLSSSIRGRILDRNGKILVDNEGVNTLVFNKMNKYKNENEINISSSLAKILDVDLDLIKKDYLKDYYLVLHSNGDKLIKKSEWEKYNKREISKEKIESLKYSRITDSMLNKFSDYEKKSAYIYHKLNDGYYYQDKIIKKDLSDDELELIIYLLIV